MSKVLFGDHWVPFQQFQSFLPVNELEVAVSDIINKWNSNEPIFEFLTSGSTGKPKKIQLKRDQLAASASATIEALNLKSHHTAMLCINPQFIGGTMMIIRALVNEMPLLLKEPSGNPLKHVETKVDFIALVPLQLHEILRNPTTKKKLSEVRTVIVGGGAVNKNILSEIENLPCKIYSTYGMTETVSHIALRKLNGVDKSEYYSTLPEVKIRTDDRDCLIINAPSTDSKDIVTNDIVEIYDSTTFKWIGRFDNAINTGGIKINSELLEEKISLILHDHKISNNFFISSLPDEKLGEKIVLFLEADQVTDTFKGELKKRLSKFECPKEVFIINKFQYTDNSKINRLATKEAFVKKH